MSKATAVRKNTRENHFHPLSSHTPTKRTWTKSWAVQYECHLVRNTFIHVCASQLCGTRLWGISSALKLLNYVHSKGRLLIISEKWKIFITRLFRAQRTLTVCSGHQTLIHPPRPHPSHSSMHGGQAGCWAELSRLSHYLIKRLGDAGLQLPVQRPPHLQAAVISLRGNIFTNRVPSQPLYQARMTSQSS